MKRDEKSGRGILHAGILFIVLFVVWTLLVQVIDVQPVGQAGTDIGFATLNCRFHKLTGVHMMIYHITDWLGLVPIFICMLFGWIGMIQLVKRRNLFKVDYDIILLGIYYVIVILSYLVFEMFPINYRPVLIDGFIEASYPSSTTLLVLSVMPTLAFQAKRRCKNEIIKRLLSFFVTIFSVFVVLGRLVSGVHWFTDIVGAVLLSTGLFCIYKAIVLLIYKEEKRDGGSVHGIS